MPHFFLLRDSAVWQSFSLLSESICEFSNPIDDLRLKVQLLLHILVESDQGLIGVDQFVPEALHEHGLV